MSNIQVGKILELFISTRESSKRVNKPVVELDELGAIGDKFYNKDSSRSILITSIDSYDLVKGYGIDMPHGYLGENLLIDFNPYSLAIGTKLKIGTALLEISQNCTICNHLSTIDKRIPRLLKKERGIFAKVIKSGKATKGDAVYLLEG
ncbi:MAG: MOSC domain-containing protein [Sulfurimonas sp.]|uniref:MOSC domain-containing protein n=1 Tax=Sulfurimonas sp. TaxID=2022749 RepID=UPI0025F9E1BB|nr:MOSC domain-containing protein [Sulfurimonas sp.]MCK9455492.1 MOSC domain-containing protein [Sulfurimonas sp.]